MTVGERTRRVGLYGVIALMVAIASSVFLAYDTGSPTGVSPAAADARVHAAPPASAPPASAPSSPEPTTTEPAATTGAPAPQVDLGAGLPAAAAAAGDAVNLGVAILDLRTGEVVGSGGDKQFYSA